MNIRRWNDAPAIRGPARRGVSSRPDGNRPAAELSMALPRNFPETDIAVR
jgi:hypothetical protein